MDIIAIKKACQGFLLASSAIEREGIRRLSPHIKIPIHLDYLAPFCTNSSFTIELALKTIIFNKSGKTLTGHNLKKLFHMLPYDIRNNITNEVRALLKIRNNQFDTFLNELSDMFIQSRYFFEDNSKFMIRYIFLRTFMIVISKYAIGDLMDVDSFFTSVAKI